MATRIREEIIDDLTDEEGAEHRSFALDGQVYEIDLTSASMRKLERALAPFIEKARKGRSTGARKSKGSPENQKIRAWAIEHNLLSTESRGRVPQRIRDAYAAGDPALARD